MPSKPLKVTNFSHRVCIVGGGSWGTAIATVVAENCSRHPQLLSRVTMWVHDEEMPAGGTLASSINASHYNQKYLPGVRLPDNVVAEPDLERAAHGATLLVLVVPVEYLSRGILVRLLENAAPNCRAVSLIKGLLFEDGKPALISKWVEKELQGMDVSVLMGANIASEVGAGQFCEATLGCNDPKAGPIWQLVFNLERFRINVVMDAAGVELCGALKNIVALGAGFCDGLGYGANTKAAIVRIGLEEMMRFCRIFFRVDTSTFFESCGVAELIASAYGGRTRKVASAFVTTGKSWQQLEVELLGGQKLQDMQRFKDVMAALKKHGVEDKFPLFSKIYRIAYENAPCEEIVKLPERVAWRQKVKTRIVPRWLAVLLAIIVVIAALYVYAAWLDIRALEYGACRTMKALNGAEHGTCKW